MSKKKNTYALLQIKISGRNFGKEINSRSRLGKKKAIFDIIYIDVVVSNILLFVFDTFFLQNKCVIEKGVMPL